MLHKNTTAPVLPSNYDLVKDGFKNAAYHTGATVAGLGGVALTVPVALFGAGNEGKSVFEFGYQVSSVTLAPIVGIPAGTLLSLPYAYIAKKTRKFLPNAQIEEQNRLLELCTKPLDQKYLIEDILYKVESYTSYESINLVYTLSSKTISHQEKIQALKTYMTESSDGAYVNNGKKLFNKILDIFADNMAEVEIRNAIRKDDFDKARLLIANNKNLFTRSNSNRLNLLHKAAIENDIKTLKILIESKIDVNTTVDFPSHPGHGRAALCLAYEQKNTESIIELIKAGAYTWFDKKNVHFIHLAIERGDLKIVQALLEAFPDLLVLKTNKYPTLLCCAIKANRPSMVDLLLKKKVSLEGIQSLEISLDDYIRDFNHQQNMLQIKKSLYNAGFNAEHINNLREKLRDIVGFLNQYNWEQQGQGLFGTHAPDGYIKIRGCLSNKRVKNIDCIDKLKPYDILEIASELKKIEFSSSSYRSNVTATLYGKVQSIELTFTHNTQPTASTRRLSR